MKLLPYEDFEIITQLKPDEAWAKLQNAIIPFHLTPAVGLFASKIDPAYPFTGKIVNNNFWLEPVWYNGKRGEMPVTKGTIEPYDERSLVKVRVGPSFTTIIPVIFSLALEALFIGYAFSGAGWPFIVLAIFAPIVSYLAIVFMNASTVVHIKADLTKIFNG